MEKALLPLSLLVHCFALLLFGCAHCTHTPVQFTTKNNILLTALPRENETAVYKFDGTFYADRIAQLAYIAKEGGSTQSNDVLEYGEFLKLRKAKNLDEKIVEKFEKAVQQMDSKIDQMAKENQILGTKVIKIGQFRAKMSKENESTAATDPSLHRLVLNCKQFMRKLMSEEGEGSWVDIYSFMGAGREQPRYGIVLRNIYELAKIQSGKLDEMINEAMWEEHERNHQRRSRLNRRRVLVEGAGPIGLFSAFHLFLTGAHVTVLNDRSERYTRNHMTFLDAKFMAQLRLFLGTKFDELYNKKTSLGRINTLDGEVGQQNVKVLEQLFKERLAELANFVEMKIGTEKASRLKLLYQAELIGVKKRKGKKGRPTAGFEAIVRVPWRINAEQQMLNENRIKKRAQLSGIDAEAAKEQLIEERTESILQFWASRRAAAAHGQRRGLTNAADKEVEKERRRTSAANRQAQLEMEAKVSEVRPLPPIPFDILFCAGGANDKIRDKLLGKPLRRSISKNYGLAVFVKGNPDENVFDHLTGFFNVKMSDFEPLLRQQDFDGFVAKYKDILPKTLTKRYSNLTQLIVRGIAKEGDKYERDQMDMRHTKPIYKRMKGRFVLADPREEPRQIVRLFENRPSLHIASITPPAVEEFVRDVKRAWQQATKEPKRQERINEVRLRFERKWNAAIFDMCIRNAHPEKVGKITINMDADGVPGKEFRKDQLNIDPLPYNTSIFALTISAVQNAVKVIAADDDDGENGNDISAIIATIGDANTSPHFMTTSGLSTGRMGVEWSAYALRDYHQGKITANELTERMRERLNSIEGRVIEKVQEYVTIEAKSGDKKEQLSHLDKNEDNVYKAIYHPSRA